VHPVVRSTGDSPAAPSGNNPAQVQTGVTEIGSDLTELQATLNRLLTTG
jgi:hypothetical protein